MENVFLSLLNISITASWIVLAIMLLRFALKKAPKWVFCVLWAVVGLRLVMPFSLESVFSLLPEKNPIFSETYQVQTGVDVIDHAVNDYLHDYNSAQKDTEKVDTDVNVDADTPAASNPTASPLKIISWIWIGGMVLMGVYAVAAWLIVRRKVRESVHYEGNIYFCDHVESAFILGVFRPRIYLNSGLPETQAAYVIRHEKAHLQRLDHIWKPVGFLLLTVHWFNPLMWIAYIMLCKDIELACDEKVIKSMNLTDKKGYSLALLSCSVQKRVIAACPVAFGEVAVKDRIKSVVNYRKPAFWAILAAIAVCVSVAACFLTDPVSKETDYSYNNIKQQYEKVQERFSTEAEPDEAEYYRVYSKLLRMVSEGAGKEMEQLAGLTREILNDSVAFNDENVFTVSSSYADIYQQISAGEGGIKSLEADATGRNIAIKVNYLGPLRYSIRMVDIGDNWYSNAYKEQPYEGELGENLVELTIYDNGPSKEFRRKYPAGPIHSIGKVKPGSYEVTMKCVDRGTNGYKMYISCDLLFSVEEKQYVEAANPEGYFWLTLSMDGFVGTYKNVVSSVAVGFNLSNYDVYYLTKDTYKRLSESEAREMYAVSDEQIKRSLEAYVYNRYPNFDQLSEKEKSQLQRNFSDRNVENCRLIASKGGERMIIADTYSLEEVNVVQRIIELVD